MFDIVEASPAQAGAHAVASPRRSPLERDPLADALQRGREIAALMQRRAELRRAMAAIRAARADGADAPIWTAPYRDELVALGWLA